MKLSRILVANRGEIAIRVARAAHDYGIEALGICTAEEDPSLMKRFFDEVIEIPGEGVSAYLDQEQLIALALAHEADGVHPGYGFLSENSEFAESVAAHGMCWIGPSADAIRLLGNKVVARRLANELPWLSNPVLELGDDAPNEILEFVEANGLPVVFKATDGGGGRGMRVVRDRSDLMESFEAAKSESKRSFGSERLMLERFIEGARHVELQILADRYGGLAFVGTRDCSLQRRYQKLLEEAPAPGISGSTFQQMCEVAAHLCRRCDYRGAGTFEFLVGAHAELIFLEVNTRLQVEHTVTEETSGLDLVIEQFRIAEGGEVPVVDPVKVQGHAIEFRVNADDLHNGFLPSTGRVNSLVLPSGPGVRVDAGVDEGSCVGQQFDSLLMKVVVHGFDREIAIMRARRALGELVIDGVQTNLDLFSFVLESPEFRGDSGTFVDNGWLEREVLPNFACKGGVVHQEHLFMVGEQWFDASRVLDAEQLALLPASVGDRATREFGGKVDVVAPMQGVVTRVLVSEGVFVTANSPLFALEAMKMENVVLAPVDGCVESVLIEPGDNLRRGQGCVLLNVEGLRGVSEKSS